MEERCELCDLPARAYCESDEASLCWDCDAKVHGANFLVARHSRSILCCSCYLPTPSKASGPRLPSTAQLCHNCLFWGCKTAEEEEGENQVVPPLRLADEGEKSATSTTSCHTSCSEELSSTCRKRARHNFDLDSSAISSSLQEGEEESGAYRSAIDGEDEATSWRSTLSNGRQGRRKTIHLLRSCSSS